MRLKTFIPVPRVVSRYLKACLRQSLIVLLINIPTISFGLAMGWVSIASGETGDLETSDPTEVGANERRAVIAAAVTFCASLIGVPLSARAIVAGRKPAIIVTSAMFVACWSLKLCGGGWWIVAARAFAGLGGAGAWSISPLVAREMCSERVRGAAVSALVVANNVGVLLMLIAADLHLSHRTVLWSCLLLAMVHCMVYTLMPESPQYLAAHGYAKKARDSLAWLRGLDSDDPELLAELAEMPTKEQHVSPIKLFKDMFSHLGRRRAFYLSSIMVVGQEACGVLALMQFAERVFLLARDQTIADDTRETLGTHGEPTRHAVYLGAAQLVASALAMFLVEKVGRKRLMVWGGLVTGVSLTIGAGAVQWGVGGLWPAAALSTAVFADSAGLQPAPYAMLADMFEYEYRGCAVLLISAMAWVGNAVDVLIFPAVTAHAGLGASLALSGAITLSLTIFAQLRVPETRGRSPSDIYEELAPCRIAPSDVIVNSNHNIITKM